MPNRIAVVTGTSSGIGLLTAVELAKAGFRVVGSMRDLGRREGLEQAAVAAGVGDKLDIRRLDVTDLQSVSQFAEGIERDYGRLDLLVNNAGFSMIGFAEDLTGAEIRKQFDTNFFGQVAVTQSVLPLMRRQRSGHIVMVSSIAGLCGSLALSGYSAAKFALEGWSEVLRLETAPLGIKVVLVEPGSFKTDIWDRNVRLAEKARDGTSLNRESGRKVRLWAQRMRKGDPSEVARLITRVALNPRPRLRYLAGADAHLQLWLKRLLPWKWYEELLLRGIDRTSD